MTEALFMLYYLASAFTGVLYLFYLKGENADIGDKSIVLLSELKTGLRSPKITPFGKYVITFAWLLWVVCAHLWIVLGVIFIRLPRKVYSFMYKEI